MIKNIFSNRAVKNVGWLIGGKAAQMLINLIVGLLTARYLGPSDYGLIQYAAAYIAFFSSLCTLGIDSVLVKELIDHPDDEGTILGTSLFYRAISGVLSAIAIVCIVFVADQGDPTVLAVVILCSVGMVFRIFDVLQYRFQAKLRSKVTAVVSLIAYSITAVYKVILLALEKDVVWFAAATAIDYICMAIMLFWMYTRDGGANFRVSFAYGKQLMEKSRHFILPGLMVAIYAQTDKIMLKRMISDAEIGYYSTALSVCTVWCFVLSAIIDSMYPEIAETFRIDEKLFVKKNKRLYAVIFYISVFVSCVLTAFAEPIIMVLYGEAYMPAVVPLRVITWHTAFSYLGVARNAWIVCKDAQKYLLRVYVAAAVSNVLLNFLLIPYLGATGAALASLIAQIMTTFVAPFFIRALRENSIMMAEAILLKGLRKDENV